MSDDGRIIGFDHSDPEMGGTMGTNIMSLELQDAEAKMAKEPVRYHLLGTEEGYMDEEKIDMQLTVYPEESKGVSNVECILHILSQEVEIESTNNLKGTLKGKKMKISQESEDVSVSYEGTFDGSSFDGEYSVLGVKAYGGEFYLKVK